MLAIRPSRLVLRFSALLALGGCVLMPEDAAEEQERIVEQGKPYAPAVELRLLPELPDRPQWQDVLQRALLANGDLEAAYFEWQASYERVGIAAAYPNSNVTLGYSYAFSAGGMKSFDRSTFSLGFDSMENLSFPTKVQQQAKLALDQARAAGERFRAIKFDVQKRVLVAWADYTLLGERLRIEREQRELGRILFESAHARVLAGGNQQDLLSADVTNQLSDDAVRSTEAELDAARALLNGLLARSSDSPLTPPTPLPAPRVLPADDATLLAASVEKNPELAALAREAAGRSDALELARLQWIPDINPSAVITGGAVEALGAAIVLPTAIQEIEGGIREAEAMLRAGDAALQQARQDRAASFVATLVALRNAERQAALFETRIVPLAAEAASIARQGYVAGSSAYRDLIAAEKAQLDSRLALGQARMGREKRLAELEALLGADIETFANATPDRAPAASLERSVESVPIGGVR